MANVKPVRFTETLHMRCDTAYLEALDKVRIQRAGPDGIPSRADVLRDLVYEALDAPAVAKKPAKRRA